MAGPVYADTTEGQDAPVEESSASLTGGDHNESKAIDPGDQDRGARAGLKRIREPLRRTKRRTQRFIRRGLTSVPSGVTAVTGRLLSGVAWPVTVAGFVVVAGTSAATAVQLSPDTLASLHDILGPNFFDPEWAKKAAFLAKISLGYSVPALQVSRNLKEWARRSSLARQARKLQNPSPDHARDLEIVEHEVASLYHKLAAAVDRRLAKRQVKRWPGAFVGGVLGLMDRRLAKRKVKREPNSERKVSRATRRSLVEVRFWRRLHNRLSQRHR